MAIGRAGAIPPLIRLLEDHEQRIRVVAAAVLSDLASENLENQLAITEGGAVAPVVRILRRDEAPALVMAASLLKSLAQGAEALEAAVEPLVALLQGKTLLAQEQAASTLGALAAHSRAIQASIVRHGAIKPLVERLHGDMMKAQSSSEAHSIYMYMPYIACMQISHGLWPGYRHRGPPEPGAEERGEPRSHRRGWISYGFPMALSYLRQIVVDREAGAIEPLMKLLEDAMPEALETPFPLLWTS